MSWNEMSAYAEACLIIETLQKNSLEAYFVGGWVRDFLLGEEGDDIDIATGASLDQIIAIFPQAQLIGAAFSVALVPMGKYSFEVASFRKEADYLDGRRPSSISAASWEEDVRRRDFTINGLYYDPCKKEVFDWVGGEKDLQDQKLRTIGDPHKRFAEDRLRILRALRFATKFSLSIDAATLQAIEEQKSFLLSSVSPERIAQELGKIQSADLFPKALQTMISWGLCRELLGDLYDEDKGQEAFVKAKLFPKKAPVSACLLSLCRNNSQPLAILIKRLSLSRRDRKRAEYFWMSFSSFRKSLLSPLSMDQCLMIYAHPDFFFVLEIFAIYLPYPERFLSFHRRHYADLLFHIHNAQKGIRLISAKDLMALGYRPSAEMGEILREAERLSICLDLRTKEDLLYLLRQGILRGKE